MNHQAVRKGIVQAQYNSSSFTIMSFELLVISIGVGYYFKSWWIGGGLFLLFILGLRSKYVAIPIMFLGAILWGLIGFLIGSLFGEIAAQIVISVISFIVGFGVHFSAIEWAHDIGDVYQE